MKSFTLRFYHGGIGLLFFVSFHANATISRDPTMPGLQAAPSVSKQAPPRPNYVLRSILVDNGRRIALINDMFVSKGDMVNNAEVIAIHKNSVDLMESGQKVTLYLFDEIQE